MYDDSDLESGNSLEKNMLERIMELYGDKIASAVKVVGVYEFNLYGEGPDGRFIVKILETPKKKYTCLVSHCLIPNHTGKPFRPLFDYYDSEETALSAALTIGLEVYSPDDRGAEWIENTNF